LSLYCLTGLIVVPITQEKINSHQSGGNMTDISKADNISLCPSARADWDNSQVFGVVSGTVDVPKVSYLKHTRPSTETISKLQGEVTPEEVFRVAAPCEEKSCQHFDGQDCRLAMRIVDQLPVVADQLPPCAIRRDCRWWQQEGVAAYFRCPQVVTDNYNASELMISVLTPQ
jgi:hypothetical protein